MNYIKYLVFISSLLIIPTKLLADTLLDFNFSNDFLTENFNKWAYIDKGKNPCAIYNGENISKLCSDNNYKFYLYYNNYNTNHMGWMRYGYIDFDNKKSITGSSLQIKLTGGVFPDNAGNLTSLGKAIYSKSDFTDENDYAKSELLDISPRSATLYFKSPSSTTTFPELQNKNRLIVWVLWPKKEENINNYLMNPNLTRPNRTFSMYTFINRSTGGHYYHNVSSIPMGGWTKIQFDAHPQHHNSGSNNPYSAFPVGGYDYPGKGIEYFNNITSLAFSSGFHGQYSFPAFLNIDDISSELVMHENNETINNVAIGYDQENKVFDISFADKYRCSQCYATYILKYSFSPITLDNFEQAYTPYEMTNFNRSKNNTEGKIFKPNPGYNNIWAAFTVKQAHLGYLMNGSKIYFAIKDISTRESITQDPLDFEEQNIPGKGKIKTIDLIKTISYTINYVQYPLDIVTEKLSDGIIGYYFHEKVVTSGGTPPYKLSTSSTLPKGINLNDNGEVSGIPNESGDFNTIIKVKDSNNLEYEKSIEWRINSEEDLITPNCSLIVDFNEDNNGMDYINIEGFDTVISDKYTNNVEYGKSIIIGENGKYNYQGVTGNIGITLTPNDSIRSVWYNNSDKTIIFTPKISFNDRDRVSHTLDKIWHEKSTIKIMPYQWGVSEYIVTQSLSSKIININVNYDQKKTLILDKIEYKSKTNILNNECPHPHSNTQYTTSPLTIDNNYLDSFETNKYHSTHIKVSGGTPPYRISTISKLPIGVSLSSTGLMQGIPLSPGEFDIEFQAIDNRGQSTSKLLSVYVLPNNLNITVSK